MVCGSKGELQFFDLALTPLFIQVADEQSSANSTASSQQLLHVSVLSTLPFRVISSIHRTPVLLHRAGWGSDAREGEGHGGCYDNFVAVFNQVCRSRGLQFPFLCLEFSHKRSSSTDTV